MHRHWALLFPLPIVMLALVECGDSTPSCTNGCNVQGVTVCANGGLSTCQQTSSGCLQFVAHAECPSGTCKDGISCTAAQDAAPIDCSAFTSCETCIGQNQNGSGPCVYDPSTSACVSWSIFDDAGADLFAGPASQCAAAKKCFPCGAYPTNGICGNAAYCDCIIETGGTSPPSTSCTHANTAPTDYCCP